MGGTWRLTRFSSQIAYLALRSEQRLLPWYEARNHVGGMGQLARLYAGMNEQKKSCGRRRTICSPDTVTRYRSSRVRQKQDQGGGISWAPEEEEKEEKEKKKKRPFSSFLFLLFFKVFSFLLLLLQSLFFSFSPSSFLFIFSSFFFFFFRTITPCVLPSPNRWSGSGGTPVGLGLHRSSLPWGVVIEVGVGGSRCGATRECVDITAYPKRKKKKRLEYIREKKKTRDLQPASCCHKSVPSASTLAYSKKKKKGRKGIDNVACKSFSQIRVACPHLGIFQKEKKERREYISTSKKENPRRQPTFPELETPFHTIVLFTFALHTVPTRLRRANCCSRIRSCNIRVRCR